MPGPLAAASAAKMARRMAPLAVEAYRRYQRMTPEEKERYRQRAKSAADRGRSAFEQAQARRRRPPGSPPA